MQCKPKVSYSNPRTIAQIADPLQDRLWTAMSDAPRKGLLVVSGKRTDWMQWLIRHDRCPGRECDSRCKGNPTTALPGRSNHRNLGWVNGKLVAAGDMGGIDLNWLGAREEDYGLHRPVRGEKWHFECKGEPKVRIFRYGDPIRPQKDPNAGRHWVGFSPGDIDGVKGTIYRRGGFDNQIAEVQIRLIMLAKTTKNEHLHPGALDGTYGSRSTSDLLAASIEFHRWGRDMVKFMRAGGSKEPLWPEKPDGHWGRRKINLLRWFTA